MLLLLGGWRARKRAPNSSVPQPRRATVTCDLRAPPWSPTSVASHPKRGADDRTVAVKLRQGPSQRETALRRAVKTVPGGLRVTDTLCHYPVPIFPSLAIHVILATSWRDK